MSFDSWLLILSVAMGAGFFGALSGLGGGVFIVPLLANFFGLPMPEAVTASLIAMIANSSAASVVQINRSATINHRLAILLTLPAVLGALIGAVTGVLINGHLIMIIFGIAVLISAIFSFVSLQERIEPLPKSAFAERLRLSGTYMTPQGEKPYHLVHIGWAIAWMILAGWLSGVLGIGSGVLSVIVFNKLLRMPFQVAAATSNAMIGAVVASSVSLYYFKGHLQVLPTSAAALGMLIGAFFGALCAPKIKVHALKYIFGSLVVIVAIKMLWVGLGGL